MGDRPGRTVLFRGVLGGEENAYSYGGIASLRGGLARPTVAFAEVGHPTMALPTLVMTNEPAAAMSINTSGVRDRDRHTMTTVIRNAMMACRPGRRAG
jgi:hypothetical protein